MPDQCQRINEQWPPFADAFREIHRFILKAVDGNAAAANALFQKYLNGELPDELLRISRSWVQEERACAASRSEGDSIGVADPQASEHSRLSGQWSDDDYDVLENGVIIGHIFKVPIAPAERPWMWASGHKAAHGYEPTRATAMTAFAKSWRRS